jgi:hypothetical protein
MKFRWYPEQHVRAEECPVLTHTGKLLQQVVVAAQGVRVVVDPRASAKVEKSSGGAVAAHYEPGEVDRPPWRPTVPEHRRSGEQLYRRSLVLEQQNSDGAHMNPTSASPLEKGPRLPHRPRYPRLYRERGPLSQYLPQVLDDRLEEPAGMPGER